MATTIRAARSEDVPVILEMLTAAAVEQGHAQDLCVDAEALRADGFGAVPRFHALVAEIDGTPAGLALYYFNYSTWTSRNGLYLEDLYVRPRFRRSGVGRELMRRLEAVAVEQGCGRFHWVVLRENTAAVRFYESLGGKLSSEWGLMQIPGSSQKIRSKSGQKP